MASFLRKWPKICRPLVPHARNISARSLTPSVGATLEGISLSKDADANAAVAGEVHQVLMKHGVCFLRNMQEASDDELVRLAGELGNLEGPHPVYSPDPTSSPAVVAHDANNPPDGAEWHTDCSWSSAPPFASVLWPKLLPECGGDTLWLSSCSAYDSLPSGMQLDLLELSAVHDMGSFRNTYAKENGAAGIAAGHAKFGSAIHPIVRTHPVTKRRCLFVNESFTVQVVGLMAGESRRLLDYLFSHLQRPDLQCRWRWRLGDVAIWDNRSTQHYACADYAGEARQMHRVTVIDDKMGEEFQ